jgi:uncharacterized protein with PIN domain
MSATTGTSRLYCDAMLASLAQWLRAAGYDNARRMQARLAQWRAPARNGPGT